MGKEQDNSGVKIAAVDDESFESEQKLINSSSMEDKGKRLWKKVKYQLVEYHSLPSYLKDNEYILRYYRAEWPLKDTLLSIFHIHNETLNVWTHLIGFFFFLSLTIYTATKVPSIAMPDLQKYREELKTSLNSMDLQSAKEDLANIIARQLARWPFFAFLGGAMFCLLASSTCHLLSCHSERTSYLMLRLDYAGIAALISTSFYPPVYYSFMCYPFFCNLYMGFITLLGIGTIFISLLPKFQSPQFRSTRAALFFGMGVSGVAPILHKLILFWNQPEALHTTGYEILMGVFYGIGALIYAKRVPERWMPGKFDILGNSHQWFHLFVVAGAYTHYQAGLVYLRWRDLKGC